MTHPFESVLDRTSLLCGSPRIRKMYELRQRLTNRAQRLDAMKKTDARRKEVESAQIADKTALLDLEVRG